MLNGTTSELQAELAWNVALTEEEGRQPCLLKAMQTQRHKFRGRGKGAKKLGVRAVGCGSGSFADGIVLQKGT